MEMKALSENKKAIRSWIEQHRQEFDELALGIWSKPEIAFEEHEAVRLQIEFLEKYGFRVTRFEGMPTAFMAERGEGGPVVGLLGEYDALAGLSQNVCTAPDPVSAGAAGHGCGHNLLGVGTMLAAVAAAEVLTERGVPVTVRYYGCPGEEQLTGKGMMAKLGCFGGTDVAMAWHPNDRSNVSDQTMTALVSARFTFKGRAAHAGACPEAGRSALDALELMNIGANYLREHMLDQDRLHYVTTNGGLAPNIVPSSAEAWYYARAPHIDELVSLWRRLLKVANGAAMMTETEVSFKLVGGCYNTLANPVISDVLEENLLSFAGKIEYTDEERAFADELQATLPEGAVAAALAVVPKLTPGDETLASAPLARLENCGSKFIMGSTDVGDVGHIMPTAMIWGTSWPVGVPAHSWQSTASSGSSIGLKGQTQIGTAMAGAICDLAEDPSLVERAKQAFAEQRAGKSYKPIDELLTEEPA